MTRLVPVARTLFVALVAALALCAPAASAAPGDLDPGYGDNGIGFVRYGGDSSGYFAARPDGSAVIGAVDFRSDSPSAKGRTEFLTRLTAYGTPDNSFGDFGSQTFDTGLQSLSLEALGFGSGGAVVAAGTVAEPAPSVATARFTPTPSNIHVDSYPAGGASARGLVVQRDDNVVIAGGCSGTPCLERFQPAMDARDMSFGSNGRTSGGRFRGEFTAAAERPGGSLVAVGSVAAGKGRSKIVVARYLADGTLDKRFGRKTGARGQVTSSFTRGQNTASAVALQPNGKILVAGRIVRQANSEIRGVVARYRADGRIDRSFAHHGHLVFKATPNYSEFNGVAVASDGKIVVAGNGGTNQSLVARFARSGALDRGFGKRGFVLGLQNFLWSRATGVAITTSGRILVGAVLQGAGMYLPTVVALQR